MQNSASTNGGEKVSVVDIPESESPDANLEIPIPIPSNGNKKTPGRRSSRAPDAKPGSQFVFPEVRINSKPYSKPGRQAFNHWSSQSQSQGQNQESSEDKHQCSSACITSRLHEAAKEGNAEQVELLLEEGIIDPNAQDCLGRTALHYAVKGECNCDACIASAVNCVRLLVESHRSDINIQDSNGDTALHLAAENQSTKCASVLLYSGADVSIKSKSGAKAVKLMVQKIPDAMDCLLNRAISIEKYDTSNSKCEIKLDFGAIVGYESKASKNSEKKYQKNDLDPTQKMYKKETQLLTLILDARSTARKKILTHPLIAIFLYLKWRKIRPLFWGMILFHAALLLLYTLYILDVYVISCPYRPKITEPAAVKAAKAAGITEGFLTRENETFRAEYIKFSWFQFSPQLNMKEIQLGITECHLEIGPTVKSVLLLSLTILMTFNEIFKLLPSPKVYLKSSNNQLQWTYFLFIYLTAWPVFMAAPNISFWQYQAAAFGLFLAWSIMLFQIGKFPKLGLYVEILTQVLKNFGFFMLTYASLVIAFALAFCVLFPGNAPYSSIPLSILKVLMMMVGEVNYEDLFYGAEENPVDDLLYPITGHVLYGAFVIMITIVLMNLLVGLTVSDIQGLQKDAEVTRLTRQISEISQLENFIFSTRLQSITPGRLGSFLRESILVVSPSKYSQTREDAKGPCSVPLVENCSLLIRPNDPNDRLVSEELKLAILKVAQLRHRTSRTTQCKNFLKFFRDPETFPGGLQSPSWDEPSVGSPHWLPSKSHDKDKSNLTVPVGEIRMEPGDKSRLGLNFNDEGAERDGRAHSSRRTRGGNTPPQYDFVRRLSGTTPPQYDYFLRRLEEKIMDRMKVQMDTLYQRIEDRMTDMK